MARERLGSRLGFLLLSAGCAIGLGNVWRFPWIAGQYGGAWFVLIYLGFLLAVGLPILVMEFAVGRASRRNMGRAFHMLEPAGTGWHRFGWFSLAGSYLLMMLYIPVAGWMLAYCRHMTAGRLALDPAGVGAFFGAMLADPAAMTGWAALVLAVSLLVCRLGVRRGLERVAKVMMSGLLIIMIVLAVRSLTLDGSGPGLSFYLAPDLGRLKAAGVMNALSAAMNQSFFTLGLGIGSMLIFGSYLDDRRSLTGESLWIVALDSFVALTAGLIIFPACFAYGVQPDSGPSLIFITLPNIFNQMPMGVLWGGLFFVFMSCAALTTVIAVVENIISYSMDVHGWSRQRSTLVHGCCLAALMMPCILGFNEWASFTPFGPGSCVLDLEDFLLSGNLLPVGVTVFILFCTRRRGWGWEAFLAEADRGEGLKFPRWLRLYLKWVLPVIVLVLFVQGYVAKFLP